MGLTQIDRWHSCSEHKLLQNQQFYAMQVRHLNDANLLKLINFIKLSRTNSGKERRDELTEVRKENIQWGLKDLDEVRVMASDGFWKGLTGQ